MKTIWIIGWMSWESSLEYYRLINEKVKEELWWLHSAKLILNSLDFAEIEKLQHENKWKELTQIMTDAATSLEKAGADMILIWTNTMHKMANEVQNSISIPLIHIADSTAEMVKKQNLHKVALLWTKFTMEEDFYKWRLEEKHWLEVIIPDTEDREIIHNIIYNELCLWKIDDSSKQKYITIINKLIQSGAEWIILWCTEIPLLIKQEDVLVPILDTTKIHAEHSVMKTI